MGLNLLLTLFIVGLWLYSLKTHNPTEEFIVAASIIVSSLIIVATLPIEIRAVMCATCSSALAAKYRSKHVVAIGSINAALLLSILSWVYFRV